MKAGVSHFPTIINEMKKKLGEGISFTVIADIRRQMGLSPKKKAKKKVKRAKKARRAKKPKRRAAKRGRRKATKANNAQCLVAAAGQVTPCAGKAEAQRLVARLIAKGADAADISIYRKQTFSIRTTVKLG